MSVRGAVRARLTGLAWSMIWLSPWVVAMGCEEATGTDAAASTSAASGDDHAATSFVDYLVHVDVQAGATAPGTDQAGPTLVRGWVTVAALTAMSCTDVAQRADPVPSAVREALQRVADWLVPPAWAGHSEGGLPAWQVKGSQVLALHQDATALHGLASEQAEPLCRLHLLLGRAEADATTLADLPDDVTMSRMTLHLELAWADGRRRTVRSDVGWGEVLHASPSLPAGDGEATVTLRPHVALAAAAAEVDLATASDKDAGRAVVAALVQTASASYADGR